jgi:hypothetical protein
MAAWEAMGDAATQNIRREHFWVINGQKGNVLNK